MILEAFAKYLQSADQELPASAILARWLWERLSVPPENQVDRVLHCEISLTGIAADSDQALKFHSTVDDRTYVFSGLSASGRKLLNTLYHYALSYEQQKWARWVHKVKASDFNVPPGGV